MIQQATVDYYTDPTATNDLILKAVDEFDNGWVYTQGVADYSIDTSLAIGLVSNGPNDTIGDFEDSRVSDVFDKIVPVFEKLGTPPADGLKATDIYTNEFIDTSIGLTK